MLQKQYNQHNVIESIETALIGYDECNNPIACGCFKVITKDTVEIKRMFVKPHCRRRGFAKILLKMLEKWAYELGYTKALLETGERQPEAIAMYMQCNYSIIPNYGVYMGMENSVCMQKVLKDDEWQKVLLEHH